MEHGDYRVGVETGGQIEVEITARAQEADGIVSLELRATNGAPLPRFEAGAHIDVHVAPGCVRQYSLCNDPAESDRYRLGVLLEANSRGGSSAIHAGFPVGQKLLISAPRNKFGLVESAERSVLLAGGIGVTPLVAMAHRLQALGAPFAFHYCARTAGRTAFLQELRTASFAGKVSIHIDDEGPAFDIDAALAGVSPGAHLYLCGPAGFIAFVQAAAERLGWPAAQVHLEHFAAEIDATGAAFEVEARLSGVTVTVPGDKSIAQVLLERGIDVPLSCEQGVCGTCVTEVIEGEPDHRDLFLSDDEHNANTEMAICCSRARSVRLVRRSFPSCHTGPPMATILVRPGSPRRRASGRG